MPTRALRKDNSRIARDDALIRLLVVCTSPLHCVYVLWHNAFYAIIDITDIGPGKISIPKEKEE